MPLSGIRVVDLTRILAGPFCTQLLADLGAEVVKVEAPGQGDPVRGQGVIRNGLSWYFAQFNRNKKSITIDLYKDEGRAVLADLISRADVLVENYRPGVLEKMGFFQARLRELNPGLVVASVNGFGSTGPYVDRPAFDFIAQAMSGFMSTSGEPDGEPMRAGPPISDLIAGLYAALGAASALLARERGTTSGGQRLEASLMNGLISMLAYASASYLATGELPERTGNDHPVVYPYGLFHASDGEIAVAPSTEVMVRRFLGALELSRLLDEPDFATNQARMDNRERLKPLINEKTRARTVEAWIERLNGAGVPCGRVMNLAEVFSDPQVLAQDMVLEADHPGHGLVRITGFPIKLSLTPARLRHPTPRLGEHTDEILHTLGYSPERIAALRERGVI
jgi:crotonobetainyl-CoA:carnitine CoA-transferase CaiB-like acyl-CoA transferase